MDTNVLYYGDNLPILRKHIPDESVDLVYLDPPFNSNRAYSLIFKDESGRAFDAQQVAFDDTWHWGPSAEAHYAYLTNTARHEGAVPSQVSALISALHAGIRPSPMLAYLVEMTVRLVHLHRVLKPTGSLWLHCDPTASHYLKVVLDAIFGADAFINEVVWRRTTPKGLASVRMPRNHDVILAYGRDPAQVRWAPVYRPHDPGRTAQKYSLRDEDGRAYQLTSLLNPNPDRPNLHYEYKGVVRTWRWTRERMDEADQQGLIVVPRPGAVPRFKRYLDEQEGIPLDDVWVDIPAINAVARERLGYPTQKPLALLERILALGSSPGDVVLDPFCGCGTALAAAQKLGRRWIGIDITYLAINVIRKRMLDHFPELGDVPIIGRPTEVEGARALLGDGSLEARYQFQWWALDLVGAVPVGGKEKKGADQGVDGIITFTDHTGAAQSVLVSVKSGKVGSPAVQQLKGALDTHKAAIGLFVTLDEPTGPMRQEAATAGFYHSELTGRDYPRIQILTIRELLEEGRKPDLPLFVASPYQRAERIGEQVDQQRLEFG